VKPTVPTATLLDVNLLIALAWPNHVHHALAHRWFTALKKRPWATCPLTQLGFVRISSNPKILADAVTPRDASDVLKRILAMPHHVFWPDDRSVPGLSAFQSLGLVGHRQVTDAYLLELARAHRGRLATLDQGLDTLILDARERNALVEVVR